VSSLLAETWVVSILIAICVFTICYLNADRVLNFFRNRSVGSRDEILDLLDRMLVDTDKRRVSQILSLISYGLGVVLFLAMWPNVISGLLLGLMGVLVGWIAPKLYAQSLWEKRCNRLADQMVDGLTIMGNSIKAGQSITQAMERVVDNLNGPFPQEMALILNKTRLGMSVEDALNEFGDRIPRQDVQMFVTAVTVLKETGGNLAETFATIVVTIRERQKVEKKINALTAQGTMQAMIITLVPFVLIGLFFVIDPAYIMPLFTRPLGWFFLLLMISLQTIGLVIMKKIVTIKV